MQTRKDREIMKHKDAVALMGKKVLITKVLYRACSDRVYEWREVNETIASHFGVDRVGWVVGVRHLPQGRRINHGWEDGTEWKQTGKTTPCLMVCPWPTERPVMVPLDGYVLNPGYEPSRYCCEWTTQGVEEMRDIMKDWPRDSRGRWIKKPVKS
jgi:hypothetical protein